MPDSVRRKIRQLELALVQGDSGPAVLEIRDDSGDLQPNTLLGGSGSSASLDGAVTGVTINASGDMVFTKGDASTTTLRPYSTMMLLVTSDGVTDAAPEIQAVLDAIPSNTKPTRIVVTGKTRGTIYLNSKVRITTDNTEVKWAAPCLIGPDIDPDGFGGISIKGNIGTERAVSSGATRGSSQIVVASTTSITTGTLLKVYDDDTTGGQAAGNRAELAEVVDISGTTLYLDHPLHHTYTGTVNCAPLTPVTNSGFVGMQATFSGQQAEGFWFTNKARFTRNCYYRDMHYRGTPTDSWSRECFNVRDSYRMRYDNCDAIFGWDYTVGTTYDYGFTADNSTNVTYIGCRAANTRHGFASDKGTAGVLYAQCFSDNGTASAFDLHGGWVRDIVYVGCVATGSNTRNASDTTKYGFLAGNTSYKAGAQYIEYVACVARGFGVYTPNGGAANSGAGYGFGVIEGSSNIRIKNCTVVDSANGVAVLSQLGTPIQGVSIEGCTFDNIHGGSSAPLPFWINMAGANSSVSDILIKGNTFVNCTNMASGRIYGASGLIITGLVIENNMWRGAGLSGVFALDIRYCSDPLVAKNTFYKVRRGIQFQNSTDACVTQNTFVKVVDGAAASQIVLDSGGNNTNLSVENNKLVGFVPTSAGTAPTSTGASVVWMPPLGKYTTAGRPSAVALGAGSRYYDTTLGKPAWSDGTNWKDAAGTTV